MEKMIICDCCGGFFENKSCYTLSTSQIVVSKEYWDDVFTREDFLPITSRHFIQKDYIATTQRANIVGGIMSQPDPWLICEKCIRLFDVDKYVAKEYTYKMLNNPSFIPPNTGTAIEVLNYDDFSDSFDYASLYAGHKLF